MEQSPFTSLFVGIVQGHQETVQKVYWLTEEGTVVTLREYHTSQECPYFPAASVVARCLYSGDCLLVSLESHFHHGGLCSL